MSLLSRDAILSADDIKTQDVEVPEWGGTIRLRAMTGTERDKLEASTVQTRGGKASMNMLNFRARLVAACAVDESGQRLFISDEDVKRLGNKNAAALNRVAEVASQISGMSESDVEELTEGFDDAPNESSTSD